MNKFLTSIFCDFSSIIALLLRSGRSIFSISLPKNLSKSSNVDSICVLTGISFGGCTIEVSNEDSSLPPLS